MIDIENIVFTKIESDIAEAYSSATVESTVITQASNFPCVSIVEIDNSVYTKTQDLDNRENHASLTYECNIYTTGNGSKSLAKAIAQVIDKAMTAMGFTRSYRGQTPNIERTIYRLTVRYTGVVAQGIEIDGDTFYNIYKK